MKFLRPQAGYEGRVGGDIKNAALTNLRRTFTITTIFTIITMHSLIFSCTGMHEFQPGPEGSHSELATSMGPQLRYAWMEVVNFDGFDSQPPSPASRELPPLGDAGCI